MSDQEVDILVDEIRRLEAENERLRGLNDLSRQTDDVNRQLRDYLHSEVTRLREDVNDAYSRGWKNAMNKVRASCGLPGI